MRKFFLNPIVLAGALHLVGIAAVGWRASEAVYVGNSGNYLLYADPVDRSIIEYRKGADVSLRTRMENGVLVTRVGNHWGRYPVMTVRPTHSHISALWHRHYAA